jgi:hypothetical protein
LVVDYDKYVVWLEILAVQLDAASLQSQHRQFGFKNHCADVNHADMYGVNDQWQLIQHLC